MLLQAHTELGNHWVEISKVRVVCGVLRVVWYGI